MFKPHCFFDIEFPYQHGERVLHQLKCRMGLLKKIRLLGCRPELSTINLMLEKLIRVTINGQRERKGWREKLREGKKERERQRD